MHYMMIMYPGGYGTAKPGTLPDHKAIEAMGKYNEELGKAGVLVTLNGLTPPATMSARVTFKGGKSKVTDGPFPEAKEWASRIPGSDNEMVEVRRFFDMSDFDPETVKKFEKQFADDQYVPGNQK